MAEMERGLGCTFGWLALSLIWMAAMAVWFVTNAAGFAAVVFLGGLVGFLYLNAKYGERL